MARLRASGRTSLPVVQQPRNPQSESIARTPYHSFGGEVEVSNTPTIRRLIPHAVTNFRAYLRERTPCMLRGGPKGQASPVPTGKPSPPLSSLSEDQDSGRG